MFFEDLRELKYRGACQKTLREHCSVDIWPFLDCILDENFKELELDGAIPYANFNEQLIPTVQIHSAPSSASQ